MTFKRILKVNLFCIILTCFLSYLIYCQGNFLFHIKQIIKKKKKDFNNV
jgi:hypothetical protein